MNYDTEIAEKILGWEVLGDRFYRDPQHPQDGPLRRLPDFLGEIGFNSLLVFLQQRGDKITVTKHPPARGTGKLFTARLNHHGKDFEETQPDDRVAVLKVALSAYAH